MTHLATLAPTDVNEAALSALIERAGFDPAAPLSKAVIEEATQYVRRWLVPAQWSWWHRASHPRWVVAGGEGLGVLIWLIGVRYIVRRRRRPTERSERDGENASV